MEHFVRRGWIDCWADFMVLHRPALLLRFHVEVSLMTVWPSKSPTAVGAVRSAVAVHVPSWRWHSTATLSSITLYEKIHHHCSWFAHHVVGRRHRVALAAARPGGYAS